MTAKKGDSWLPKLWSVMAFKKRYAQTQVKVIKKNKIKRPQESEIEYQSFLSWLSDYITS